MDFALAGAQILVAIGTGVLAFFTWRLARSTAGSVTEMKAERKLTEQALEASNRIASATEQELAATHEQVAASQTIAKVAVEERRSRWEPYITARLDVAPMMRPNGLTIENLGPGPAIDCLYIARLKDALGLEAWFLGGPVNLVGSQSEAVPIRCMGITQATYEDSDTTSVDTQLRPQRRYFELAIRAFEDDPRVTQSRISSRQMIGLEAPQEHMFYAINGPTGPVDGRLEALICKCANGHVHRSLTHQRSPQEQFEPSDPDYTWIDWYRRVAMSGLVQPSAVVEGKPGARPLRTENL